MTQIQAPALPLKTTKTYLSSHSCTSASGFPPKILALLPLSSNFSATEIAHLYTENKVIRQAATAKCAASTPAVPGEGSQLDYAIDSALPHSNIVDFQMGRLVQDGLVYRENFVIRSFDVGHGKKLTVRALMNYLQDVAISHFRSIGLSACGFGTTPEMVKRDLIWVVNSITIDVHRCPYWTDVVQIDTWKCLTGKNSLSLSWLVSDCQTGETLVRATSSNVLFNKKTRKLSKLIEGVREELAPFVKDSDSVIHHPKNSKNVSSMQHINVDTSDTIVCKGIRPGCNDLDLNQHVSHIKYIDWVLESTPPSLRDLYVLSGVTMKYLKECNRDSVLQSVSKIVKNVEDDSDGDVVELVHFIILDCGGEAARAITTWKRPAPTSNPNYN